MVAEKKGVSRRGVSAVVALMVGVSGLVGCAQSGGGSRHLGHPEDPGKILPWEWWRDLATVASVPEGDRVVMNSSHCPSGCEFDRHSQVDSRFLRIRENGEGVIFSADGAGAVTRIWMVMGDGVSESLHRKIRLRVRIDGRSRPVVDLPLPKLFAGRKAPFLTPVVADLTASGGGNVSYVPIPFREGCEIALVGAESAKIWFQITARLVDDAAGVRSFTGKEDLTLLRSILERTGVDPWPSGPTTNTSRSVVLAPGEGEVIATLTGPDLINGIIVRAARNHWKRLGLRLTFDDAEPQLIPLMDFFGALNTYGGLTQSLLVGADGDNDLYCYFPMPFHRRAVVELMRRPLEGPHQVAAEVAIRAAGLPPPENAGHFRIQVRSNKGQEFVADRGTTIFEVSGHGKWVGLTARLTSADRSGWTFLEGDERIYVDDEDTPSWHGTGVEDLFNGGFFFRDQTGSPAPFTTALAGASELTQRFLSADLYRLLLGDAIVFQSGVRAELENGLTGDLPVETRTVAYYYLRSSDPSP